jgi:hypothetical protein
LAKDRDWGSIAEGGPKREGPGEGQVKPSQDRVEFGLKFDWAPHLAKNAVLTLADLLNSSASLLANPQALLK